MFFLLNDFYFYNTEFIYHMNYLKIFGWKKQFYLFLLKTYVILAKKEIGSFFFVYNIRKHIYYNNQHFQQKQNKLPT